MGRYWWTFVLSSPEALQNPSVSHKFPYDLLTSQSHVYWSNSVKPSEKAGESKIKLSDSLGQKLFPETLSLSEKEPLELNLPFHSI